MDGLSPDASTPNPHLTLVEEGLVWPGSPWDKMGARSGLLDTPPLHRGVTEAWRRDGTPEVT